MPALSFFEVAEIDYEKKLLEDILQNEGFSEEDLFNLTNEETEESGESTEKKRFTIKNDLMADWALEKIKEIDQEFERYKEVVNGRIEQLKLALQKEEEKAQNKRNWMLYLLREYFETVKKRETKTKLSYKLPSGSIELTKDKVDFDYDREKLLQEAKERKMEEFIKTVESFDWAAFKKQLEIISDENGERRVINKETGELLEMDGLNVVIKTGKFDVKY